MTDRIELAGLSVARELKSSLQTEALPGTGVEEAAFWRSFADIVHDLAPKNRALLARREALQDQIDHWHRDNGAPSDLEAYKNFLREIGYLVPEGPAFQVTTENVDPEIATVAGPQLVVPVMNARYALNAANARWGSLYDALYGTDAIPDADGAEKGKGYNPKRGAKVIAWAGVSSTKPHRSTARSWAAVDGLAIDGAALELSADGKTARLARCRAVRRLSRRAGCARRRPAEQQRPAYRNRHRPRQSDRQDRPGRHRRPPAGSRR